MFTDQVAPQ